jgi:molybdopterin adenylyltransferase
MVLEARKLSESLKKEDIVDRDQILQSLDALGYDEAAQYVYGMDYSDWKKAHAKKASDDQMQKFNDSKPVWASHDKQLLAKRADTPAQPLLGKRREAPSDDNPHSNGAICLPNTMSSGGTNSLLSNVCCQDVEDDKPNPAPAAKKANNTARQVNSFTPPAAPSKEILIRLGILTGSDRASAGSYETGDLSGPATERAVRSMVESMPESVKVASLEKAIVPDDMNAIQQLLTKWSDSGDFNLILTTGGTGFAERDVTPEATKGILDRDCSGLLSFCTSECSKAQPLAALSRGAAGLRGHTLVANLPGNPVGVGEIVPILLPLALHILKDLGRAEN